MNTLRFELVDQNYYMADMSEIDKSGRWVIAGKKGAYNAGIECTDNPSTMPVKWLVSGNMSECKFYLRKMHSLNQNYNSFN